MGSEPLMAPNQEYRQTEPTLAQLTDQHSAILNALPATAVIDQQGYIREINTAWVEFATENDYEDQTYGLGSNYLATCLQATGPDSEDARAAAAGIQAVLAGEEKLFNMEYPCHAPWEQRWFRMIVNPVMAPKGGAVIMHINITERVLAEQGLRESEETFRTFMEVASEGIIITNQAGQITFANAAVEKIFGYERTELIGKSVEVLLPEHLRAMHVTYRANYQTSPHNREMGMGPDLFGSHKNGNLIPVEIGLSTVAMADQRLTLSFITDISARKRIEKKLQQHVEELARSNAELAQFAYIASHDLQEPLRAIAGYLQFLERGYRDKLDDRALKFINNSVAGAQRMQGLINDILDYSRVGSHNQALTTVEISTVIKAALNNLTVVIQESEAEISTDPLPAVVGDATLLTQLFQNLIGNGLKFRRESPPRIHISAQSLASTESDCLDSTDREWTFSVADNGIGFDPQYTDRIFRIFQRLHTRDEYPGAGIGLAICKKIIERHGGQIWAESEPGQGSIFFFTLPADQPPQYNIS